MKKYVIHINLKIHVTRLHYAKRNKNMVIVKPIRIYT